MTRTTLAPDVRAQLLAAPETLLNDAEVMRALMTARDAEQGTNVTDIRGRWMARLEERLDRLEATHRHVLAAAYDSVSGTRQIHRAVLAVVGAPDRATLLAVLGETLPRVLGIDAVLLMIEAGAEPLSPPVMADLHAAGDWIELGPVGAVAARLGARRAVPGAVTLRRTAGEDGVASEAVIPLDLEGRAGLLILGAAEADTFAPPQGTDLLVFLQGVIAASLARVL